MHTHGPYVHSTELHIAKLTIDARSECAEVSVAKIAIDAGNTRQLHLVARSQ